VFIANLFERNRSVIVFVEIKKPQVFGLGFESQNGKIIY